VKRCAGVVIPMASPSVARAASVISRIFMTVSFSQEGWGSPALNTCTGEQSRLAASFICSTMQLGEPQRSGGEKEENLDHPVPCPNLLSRFVGIGNDVNRRAGAAIAFDGGWIGPLMEWWVYVVVVLALRSRKVPERSGAGFASKRTKPQVLSRSYNPK
jgi:hypothetical protein